MCPQTTASSSHGHAPHQPTCLCSSPHERDPHPNPLIYKRIYTPLPMDGRASAYLMCLRPGHTGVAAAWGSGAQGGCCHVAPPLPLLQRPAQQLAGGWLGRPALQPAGQGDISRMCVDGWSGGSRSWAQSGWEVAAGWARFKQES